MKKEVAHRFVQQSHIRDVDQKTNRKSINEQEHTIKDIAFMIAENFGIERSRIVFDEHQPKGQHRKPAKTDVPSGYDFIDIESGISNSCEWFKNNYKTARK